MNIKNLKALREHLKGKIDFSMEMWLMPHSSHDESSGELNICNTVACIAGHAAILAHPNAIFVDEGSFELNDERQEVRAFAEEWLGLTELQSVWLFFGNFADASFQDTKAEHAVMALDYLIECAETGREFDFSHIVYEYEYEEDEDEY